MQTKRVFLRKFANDNQAVFDVSRAVWGHVHSILNETGFEKY